MSASEFSLLSDPSLKSLRDVFLKSFSQKYKIGRLFSHEGGVLHPGKTPTEWMLFFKIIDGEKKKALTVQELQSLFLKLTHRYHVASSFHANIFAASEKLKGIIEEKESRFIEEEISKYKPGGEFFDSELNKPSQRRPGKDVLDRLARNSASELRKTQKDLSTEVSFFNLVMTDLEYQRRCLKDYAELFNLDPSTRNF